VTTWWSRISLSQQAIVAAAFALLCTALLSIAMTSYVNNRRLKAEIEQLNAQRFSEYESYRVRELEQQLRDAGLNPK
jgi:hypothetical protein